MASEDLTVLTELSAVNILLSCIGEAPINSLTDDSVVDVATALSILREVSRKVQTQGWWFNTEEDYTLTPDVNGNISVPASFVSVELEEDYAWKHTIVQRGTALYDMMNHTDEFDAAIDCRVIYLLTFDNLPEVVRQYITIASCRVFQDRMLGSTELHKFNEIDEYRALADLKDEDNRQGGYNLYNSPGISDLQRR